MQWELNISKSAFAGLLVRLENNPDRISVCPAGVSSLPGRTVLLTHQLDLAASAARRQESRLVVAGSEKPGGLLLRLSQIMQRPYAEATAVYLGLGVGAARGDITGEVVTSLGVQPLARLRVIAECLPEARLLSSPEDVHEADASSEIWSRTIGALNDDVWARMTELRVAVFGCGRTGSLLSNALARSGIRDLTLIDPDHLEIHNFGEMEAVNIRELGRSKAESVAEALRLLVVGHDSEVRSVAESASSFAALAAAKDADVLFSCVDNPGARLNVALLSKLYMKLMVDVATGIHGPVTARQMGADIRLVLPDQCLSCFGGMGPIEQAAAQLIGSVARRGEDWRNERAGSLRSLNMVAVGAALRILEDFVAGRIEESTWLSLEYANGLPQFTRLFPASSARACPVCELTGFGDAGLDETPVLLRRLAGQ